MIIDPGIDFIMKIQIDHYGDHYSTSYKHLNINAPGIIDYILYYFFHEN